MQPVQDTAAFFQLLHVLGVPGVLTLVLLPVAILALLLFIFLRGDQKKWDAINVQSDNRWKEMLSAHKSERDRDFDHLKNLMDGLSGQYQILTTLVSKIDQVDRGTSNLGAALANVPSLFRDLHARFDQVIPHLRKDTNGPRNSGAQGPASIG